MNSQKNNSNGLLSLTSSINQDELKKITPSLFKYIFFPLERYIKEIMVLDQNTSQYDIMKKISWRISGDINIKDGVSIDEINMTLKNYKGQHLFGVLELQESDERIRNDYLILLGPQKRVNKHNYVFINDYLIFNRETLKNLMIIIRNLKGGAIIYISGINVGITIDKNSELEEIYDQVVPIGQKEEIYKNNIILKTIKEMICGETLIKKEAVQNHDVLKRKKKIYYTYLFHLTRRN